MGMNAYTCGNCSNVITFPFTSRCSKCGEEIDWTGIYVKKINVCPNCRKSNFRPDDKFCDVCPERIQLKEVEIQV